MDVQDILPGVDPHTAPGDRLTVVAQVRHVLGVLLTAIDLLAVVIITQVGDTRK